MSAASVAVKPVLEGGHLRHPVVPDTKVVAGLTFVRVSVEDNSISEFLTGKKVRSRPLKGVEIFRRLIRLRNGAMCAEGDGKDDEDEADDGMAELGLDQTQTKSDTLKTASAMSGSAKRRRLSVAQGSEVSTSLVLASASSTKGVSDEVVECSLKEPDGREWVVNALPATGRQPLWLEFTADCMQQLFDRVAAELHDRELEAPPDSDCEQEMHTPEKKKQESGRRGLFWRASRSVWDLRWIDSSKERRCKTWRVDPKLRGADFELRREEQHGEALRFAASLGLKL